MHRGSVHINGDINRDKSQGVQTLIFFSSFFFLPLTDRGFFSICPSISNSIAGAASCAFTSCPVGTEVNPSRDSSLACYGCPMGKYNVLNPDTDLTYSRCKFCKKGFQFINAHSQCDGCIAGMYQAQNVSNTNISWLIVRRQCNKRYSCTV